ncbi:hypothetical protein AL059_06170 [Pseudomonas syringae pv. papulans]|nr:hypothetical protein AL059_06170 [Pseudomonas syringae pv. papulans]
MTFPVAGLSFERSEAVAGGLQIHAGLGNHRAMFGEFDKPGQGLKSCRMRQQPIKQVILDA